MSGEEDAEVTLKEVRLSRKLYPSLSLVDMSLYTATWICGVYLACHSLYMASQEQARRLYTVDMARPWWYVLVQYICDTKSLLILGSSGVLA